MSQIAKVIYFFASKIIHELEVTLYYEIAQLLHTCLILLRISGSLYESFLCCNLAELSKHLNIFSSQMNIRRVKELWMVPLEIQLFPSSHFHSSITNGLSGLKPLQTLYWYLSSLRTSFDGWIWKEKKTRTLTGLLSNAKMDMSLPSQIRYRLSHACF